MKKTRLRSPGASPAIALGELDRARVRVAPVREEVELAQLRRRGVRQLGAAVADVHAVERREPVEVALAVSVVDVAALAGNDDRQRRVRVGRRGA